MAFLVGLALALCVAAPAGAFYEQNLVNLRKLAIIVRNVQDLQDLNLSNEQLAQPLMMRLNGMGFAFEETYSDSSSGILYLDVESQALENGRNVYYVQVTIARRVIVDTGIKDKPYLHTVGMVWTGGAFAYPDGGQAAAAVEQAISVIMDRLEKDYKQHVNPAP